MLPPMLSSFLLSSASAVPVLKLKLHFPKPPRNFIQNTPLIRRILRDEGHAEPQIRSRIVPRDSRNQLFRNQPLRRVLGRFEFHSLTVPLFRSSWRLHVKKERPLWLLCAEPRFREHFHQRAHAAGIFGRDLFRYLRVIEAMRRRVLDGQELSRVAIILHIAICFHQQFIPRDKSATPASHVER